MLEFLKLFRGEGYRSLAASGDMFTFLHRNQASYSHKPMIGSTAKTPGVFKQREYQHLDGSRLLASIGKVGVGGGGENLLFLVAHLSVDVQTRKQQRLCFTVSSFQFSVRR